MSTVSNNSKTKGKKNEMDDNKTRSEKLIEALSSTKVIEEQAKAQEIDKTTEPERSPVMPIIDAPVTPPKNTNQPTQEDVVQQHQTTQSESSRSNRFKDMVLGRKNATSDSQGPVQQQPLLQQPQPLPTQPQGQQPQPQGVQQGVGDQGGQDRKVFTVKPRYRIEGSNIGSAAREPEWTMEQLQHIAKLSNLRIGIKLMSEACDRAMLNIDLAGRACARRTTLGNNS